MTARRLFVGLMVSEPARAELAAYQACWMWPPGTKLTPAANFHLTLHFLGDVDADREARLRLALAAVPMQPLQMLLASPGHFNKGIAFIQPEPHACLDALRASLGQAVAAAGLTVETPWQPHVTLARKAGCAQPPAGFTPIAWHVERFTLAWSHGGSYAQLDAWPHAT